MTAQRATSGSILLLIALAVLFMPTGAAGSLKQHPAMGINVSSDKTTYTCSPSCTATITITNNGTINGTLRNMTIFNHYSFDASDLSIKASRNRAGSWQKVQTVSGEQTISPSVKGTPIWNHTPRRPPGTAYTMQYRFNISSSENDFGKWSITIQIGANNSATHWYRNFTLDPYIQDFRNEAPIDGNVLNDTTPTFSFSYVSSVNNSLKCGALTNRTTTPPKNRTAINATTFNATTTDIAVNSSKPLSHGMYRWRYWCDSNGDNSINSSEVSQNRTLFIDTQPPTTQFNTPAAGAILGSDFVVNATIGDEFIGVNASSVYLAIGDGSHNYSANGIKSTWTRMQQTGNHFTATVNISAFTSGNYSIWINASDSFSQTSHTRRNITIDIVAPSVTGVRINTTSNETHLTQKGLFSLGAQVDDAESSIKNCYAQAYSTIADYTDNNPLANQSMSLNTGDYNYNGTLDLRGQDGNYTIAVACRDQAGNLARNRTLHMPNSEITRWFLFDDSGPVIDEDTTSPPNASYTTQQDPVISFNVTDFSHIDGASVTVWFNTTKYSFSTSTANFSHWASWNSNSTMYFEIDPGYQLTANHSYEIKLIASDSAGDQTQNQTYWFHTDFTAPTVSQVENVTSDSQTLTRSGTVWHHETVDLNVTCTDTASFPDQLSLTGSSGSGETVQPTGNEATLSFTASSGTEKTHNLTITCTDAAGNTQQQFQTYAIDNDRPEIDQQIPSLGASLSTSLPYEQPIILRVVDSGVGFNTNAANPNPQFDGSSVSSYNSSISSDQTQYNINWSQSISSNGTHTVSLNSGSALNISDRFGKTVSVSSWEFKISDSGETVSTASTTSNASLSITDSPGTINLLPNRTHTATITVENSGGKATDVSVSIDTGSGITDATASPDQFNIAAASTTDVQITFNTASDFTGSADITVTFSYSGTSITETFTVKEKQGPGNLSLVTPLTPVNVPRGNTSTFRFTVKNTGKRRLASLTSSFEQYTTSINPKTIALIPGEKKTVNVTVDIPRDENVSIKNLTYTIKNDRASLTAHIELRIQPATEKKREQIIQNIEQLKDRVSRIKDTDTQTVAQNMLDTASKALSRGNYAKAAALADDIQARVAEAELRQKQDRGLPILPIVALILVLAAGGYSGYYLLKQRGTEKTQHTATHAPSHDTKEEPSMKEQATQLLDRVRETAQSAASSLSRPSDTDSGESTDSTGETRVKKKIRFEDIEDE